MQLDKNSLWFKRLKLAISFVIMIGLSVFIAFSNSYPPNIIAAGRFGIIMFRTVGWIGLIFFGGGAICILYQKLLYTIHGRTTIMICQEGLYIYNDFVQWNHIIAIIGCKQGLQVVTDKSDIKERLANANPIRRWNLKFSLKLTGALFIINDNDIEGTRESFVEQCKPYLETNKER